ncbi:MAG: hypothetical protein ACREIU_10160 [Planctomycetota bacterium]
MGLLTITVLLARARGCREASVPVRVGPNPGEEVVVRLDRSGEPR